MSYTRLLLLGPNSTDLILSFFELLIFYAGSSGGGRGSSGGSVKSEVLTSTPTGMAALEENVIKERKHAEFVSASSSWPYRRR